MMLKNDYQKAVDFLESLVNIPDPVSFFAKNKRRLRRREKRTVFIKRLRFLLKLLGRPDQKLKFIHVTGTSGKTSVTSFIASILGAAGFKTGIFTSPHVTSITERIALGGRFIPAGKLADIIEYLKPYLSRCAAESPYGCPSFFETVLAAALVYFKNEKCDYAVLEAGIGGMFDATNVIERAEAAVITNVGLDHLDVLGNTKQAIARDKAGIIKRGSRFFTAERDPRIIRILREACRAKRVPFRRVNGDYRILKNELSGVEFEYEGEKFKTRLAGEHQAGNAVLAFEAVREIIKGNRLALRRGIADVFIPCRLEEMPGRPRIVLDGAHNADKMSATAESVRKFKYRKLILIVGLAKNKDAAGILKNIIPLADSVYLTRFLNKGRKSQCLRRIIKISRRLTKKNISVFIDPHEALAAAKKRAGQEDLILVTGSFFLTGELRAAWFPEERILEKGKMR
jgi:dihydrofolate synthase/folylpolyglutamate synthase